MPATLPESSMSPGELAICLDFLDGHREYAIDLLSNIEKLCQLHPTDRCLETRQGRTCSLCGICSTDGLMGDTKMALASYDDAEERLKTVRASLGKSVIGRALPRQEIMFKNSLAKSIFVSIVSVGDALRSQHAAWRARLQNEIETPSASAQSPFQHANAGPSESDGNKRWDLLLQTYSGLKVVRPETNPKLPAVSTSSETTSSSSMFVVFTRCLSPDCPCELNKANMTSKTRSSEVPAVPEITSREGSHHATKSTTTSHSKRTRDASNALFKPLTNTQTREPNMHNDLNGAGARRSTNPWSEDAVLKVHAPSGPASEMVLRTHETESTSSGRNASTVDPRVTRLRTKIVRFDDARGTLMAWCRACVTEVQLNSREGTVIKPEAPLTHGTCGYLSALTCGPETAEPAKSLCATSHIATERPSRDANDTVTQELRFDEQEELKGRWLMARRKRCKDRKRRQSGLDLH